MIPSTYCLKKNISNSCWIVGFTSVYRLRHALCLRPPARQRKQSPECSQVEKNCGASCASSAGVGIFSGNGRLSSSTIPGSICWTRSASLESSVEELDSNNCTTSVGTVLLVGASSGLCCVGFHVMLGFSCATPTPPELLLPPSLDDMKTSSSFPSSVTRVK